MKKWSPWNAAMRLNSGLDAPLIISFTLWENYSVRQLIVGSCVERRSLVVKVSGYAASWKRHHVLASDRRDTEALIFGFGRV
jgi:hypothetical protein